MLWSEDVMRMNDGENMRMIAPKVKDCIVCTNFDPVWEGDGDTGEEEIVYYCHANRFGNYVQAKPTQRVVCDKFEMSGERIS
jgi:hypothetical protein